MKHVCLVTIDVSLVRSDGIIPIPATLLWHF